MDLEKLLKEIQMGIDLATPLIPIGTVDAGAKITSALVSIIGNAVKAYKVHSGEPFDLANLPEEDRV